MGVGRAQEGGVGVIVRKLVRPILAAPAHESQILLAQHRIANAAHFHNRAHHVVSPVFERRAASSPRENRRRSVACCRAKADFAGKGRLTLF